MTVITAETLIDTPKLTVAQPGHTLRTLTMTKVSSTSWKVTVHLYSSGAGAVVLRAIAHDTHHGYNSANLVITVH